MLCDFGVGVYSKIMSIYCYIVWFVIGVGCEFVLLQ